MQRVILVVSPDTEFLQQLRSHLEEGGRYQVTVALSAHEALNLANSNFFEVAIVDGELDDIPVAAFTRDLAALQSDLKILVFPPDNNPQHPVLDGLVAIGFLTKPFSGQEIGKALSNLFSDQPMSGNVQVNVVDDLVKQWLQIPETGGRKAEQILKATTAQSVLIIIKDQLIASAGSMENGLGTNVTGFLSRYWKEEENSELARFLRLDGNGSEMFLYATKLVCNVVLVLVYPMNTSIQLVRHELNNVKNDFKQHYPTTGELRQDIAKQTLADINERNKKLETLQPNSTTISQNELDMLKLLQQETQKPTTNAVSQAELDARKLFEQESMKPKPITTNGISQAEIDALKALQEHSAAPTTSVVTQAELDARKLFEQESMKPKPITTNGISQAEIDALKALQQEPPASTPSTVSQAELDARKLFEQESMKPKPITVNGISQAEIDALKALQKQPPAPTTSAVSQAELDALQLFHQESMKPATVATSNISEQELADLAKLLNQMPTPDPQPEAESPDVAQVSVEEKKQPEWLNELAAADNSGQSLESITASSLSTTESTPNGAPPFVENDENLKLTPGLAASPISEPLPEIDFKLPWEMEETTPEAVSEIIPDQPVEPAVEPVVEPVIEQSIAATQPPVEAPVAAQQPEPTTFAEVLGAVAPQVEYTQAPSSVESSAATTAEPTVPITPSLKDFRFNYTCVLVPGDHDQFLARDLSEKLSSTMPDIHEDQGWRMTSITIRPQYLLWTVAVPMGICPHKIVHEVRNLTSNLIFAKFPEIAKKKTSNDFWSSKFLAISGSEPPPANLIFDFVSQAWKTPETVTP